MKDLILFGVQGCGKGTQGRIFVEQQGYKMFETGKELRALIAGGSALGMKIKDIVEGGNLVPDEVVIEIVDNFLKNADSTEAVIFDGLPRKVTQKDLFEEVMERYGRKPLAVLIQISDELALQRLSNRWMSKATGKIYPSREAGLAEQPEGDIYQRSDDTPEAIKVRLANYHQETQPVIDWYREAERLVEVEGAGPAEEVTENIMRFINSHV